MMFEKRYIVNEMIGKGAIPVKTRAIGIYEMHRCHEQSIISNKIFLSKEVLILFLIATLISLEINKSFFFLNLKGPGPAPYCDQSVRSSVCSFEISRPEHAFSPL